MKKTYEMERIDERGNIVKFKTTIEEDRDIRRYRHNDNYGDCRSPFVNKFSTIQDRLDYEKYCDCTPHTTLDFIMDAYEDFLKCIEDFK